MNHQQYREMLSLLLYGELNEDDSSVIHEHLKECAECRSEWESLKKLHQVMGSRPTRMADNLLEASRAELRSSLNIRPASYKSWMGMAAALVVGILLGHAFFGPRHTQVAVVKPAITAPNPFSRGNVEITNLRFIDSNPSDGKVEFTFNAVA